MRQSKEIITLVFTDIARSTELWERMGQHFRYILEAHNYIIRKICKEFQGQEVKTEGDAFMLSFGTADQAIYFAIKTQEELNKAEWPGITGEIMVRIGIHTGQPIFTKDRFGQIDYLGPMVNRASRISSAANGGQILISNSTYQHAKEALNEITLKNLGEHWLRGLEKPEIIRQLLPKSLSSRKFFAIRTVDIKKTNLTSHPKSFLGREHDIYQLHRFFNIDKAKVITITGAGGTGKSRLSQRWAATSLGDYPAGVWFIDLSETKNINDICNALSDVLNTPLTSDDRVTELGYNLKGMCEHSIGSVLIVLDNCECVAEEAGQALMQWLKIAPKARFLITSRILLNIANEKEHILKQLNTPTYELLDNIDVLKKYHSVKLFCARSYEANSNFVLNDENVRDIAEICIKLDGIPLAIELAASKSRIFKANKILQRLDKRFDILQSNQQDYAKRQRTLRETIDWSWSLLDEKEQYVLAQLSVFNHNFFIEHAENVITTNDQKNFPSLINIIQRLREKSMLNIYEAEQLDQETTFGLYESIREYCLEKLTKYGIRDKTQERWKNWILKYSGECWKKYCKFHTAESYHKLHQINNELINIARSEHAQPEEAAWAAIYSIPILNKQSVGMSTKEIIHHCLKKYGISYEYNDGKIELKNIVDNEAVHHLINLLANNYKKTNPRYALMLNQLIPQHSICHFTSLVDMSLSQSILGEPTIAMELIESALQQPQCELYQKCHATLQKGNLLYLKGQLQEAETIIDFVIKNVPFTKNNLLELTSHYQMGLVQLSYGAIEKSLGHFNHSLSLCKQIHDEQNEALVIGGLGLVNIANNDFNKAIDCFKKALALSRKLNESGQEIRFLIQIAHIYLEVEDHILAKEIYDQALHLANEMNDISNTAIATGHIGNVFARKNNYNTAIKHFTTALESAKTLGEKQQQSYWLGCLGRELCNKAYTEKSNEDNFIPQLKDGIEHLNSSLELIKTSSFQRNICNEIALAQAEFELGNSDNAVILARSALEFTNMLKTKNREQKRYLKIAKKLLNINTQLT